VKSREFAAGCDFSLTAVDVVKNINDIRVKVMVTKSPHPLEFLEPNLRVKTRALPTESPTSTTVTVGIAIILNSIYPYPRRNAKF